jgi:hypothetical protein
MGRSKAKLVLSGLVTKCRFGGLAMIEKHKFALFAFTALIITLAAPPAVAQSPGSGTVGTSLGWGTLGHGMMMGPGMMDRSEFDRLCRPSAAGFAEWRIDLLNEILKPNDAQRAKFEEFKAASRKAGDAIRLACPTQIPDSMVGHMQAMEKLSDAKSQAIKAVLPTLVAFYATLSVVQKAILDSNEGRSRFLRWQDPV